MKTKASFLLVAGAMALVGCMNVDVTRNTAYACASATALLNTASTINAQLTPEDRTAISEAVAVINPICSSPTPPTLDSVAQAALAAALAKLTTAVQ